MLFCRYACHMHAAQGFRHWEASRTVHPENAAKQLLHNVYA